MPAVESATVVPLPLGLELGEECRRESGNMSGRSLGWTNLSARLSRRDRNGTGNASPPKPERRPRVSIRLLFVLLSVTYIVVATCVAWAVTYVFALRNLRDLSGALLDEARETTVQAVSTYVYAAQNMNHRTRSGFESGALTKDAWRETLEFLTISAGTFPEVGAVTAAVRFADDTILGIRNCKRGGLHGCASPDVFTSNVTHFNFYNGSDRGQPLAWRSAEPAPPTVSGMYQKVQQSPSLAAWNDLAVLRLSMENWGPLNRIAFEYGTGIRPRLPPGSLGLPVPVGVPGVPPAPGGGGRHDLPEPMAGIAVVSVGIGALAAYLEGQRLAQDGIIVIATPSGQIVATSTGVAADIIDAKGQPLAASASPSALIRTLVAEAMARPVPPPGSFNSLSADGRTYYYSRAAVSAPPTLAWNIFLAVREDAVLSEINTSITVIFATNAAWLLVAAAAAALTGVLITRPLEDMHASLSLVLETLTGMTRELRAQLRDARRPSLLTASSADDSLGPDVEWEKGEPQAPGLGSPLALSSGLRELARFEPLLSRVHARFSAFSSLVSREAQIRVETKARAEAVSKFLSTMSHEMRTPLNGIVGMLELAMDADLPPDARGYLRAASRCSEHLLFLISDILDLQRMETGSLALRQVPLDVREVVSGAVRMLGVQAEGRGIAVRAALEPGLPSTLLSDPNRLRQVLLNLIGNAIKYSPAGAGPVVVRAAAEGPPGAPGEAPLVVRFEVADSGLGIPLEAQPQLFSPFFRAHAENSGADPGGTGLGLAISRELVTRAGGAIGFHSEPGRGSTFHFTWPFRLPAAGDPPAPSSDPSSPKSPAPPAASQAAGARSAPPSAPGSPAGPTPTGIAAAPARLPPLRPEAGEGPPAAPAPAAPGGMHMRVLVVDDDEVTRRVVEQTLRNAGHAAVVAPNGALAVDLFREAAAAAPPGRFAFSAVFMDCSMPVLDGQRATEAIRRLEAERGLPRHPVVAFTAHGDADDEEACRRSGMDDVLVKPVRRAALLAKLAEVGRPLAGAEGEGEAHPPAPAPAAASLESAPPASEKPLERAPSVPRALPPPPAPGPPAGPPPRPPVLVVDDVEMNRRVLCGFLRREGLPVETAGDGSEAVDAFAARARAGGRFALVLMDVAMPGMDGRAAAGRIRALEGELGLPRTPVVACTAFADKEASLDAGMDDHLQKPVTRAALLHIVRRFCGPA